MGSPFVKVKICWNLKKPQLPRWCQPQIFHLHTEALDEFNKEAFNNIMVQGKQKFEYEFELLLL